MVLINILTRTGNRVNYFSQLKASIDAQTYNNIRHIKSNDNPNCSYLANESDVIDVIPDRQSGKAFYNLYLNELGKQVNDGWVIILDDDSKIIDNTFIEKLADICKDSSQDEILIYKCKIWDGNGRIIPCPDIFNTNTLIKGEIDMVSFCFHYSIFDKFKFTSDSCGDFNFLDSIRKSNAYQFKFVNLPIGLWGNYDGAKNGENVDKKESEQPIKTVGISLGFNCDSAVYGVNSGIRSTKKNGYKTCPFDIMLSNIGGIVQCIEDDFKYFFDENYLTIEYPHDNPPTLLRYNLIRNTKYNFIFNHESPGHADLHLIENWPGGKNHFISNHFKHFKERYEARINNFRNYLNDPSNKIIFIISTWNKTEDDFALLKNALSNRYPHLSYSFKILDCTKGKDFFVTHLRLMKVDENDPELTRLEPGPSNNEMKDHT